MEKEEEEERLNASVVAAPHTLEKKSRSWGSGGKKKEKCETGSSFPPQKRSASSPRQSGML